jgi:hypothetical protein
VGSGVGVRAGGRCGGTRRRGQRAAHAGARRVGVGCGRKLARSRRQRGGARRGAARAAAAGAFRPPFLGHFTHRPQRKGRTRYSGALSGGKSSAMAPRQCRLRGDALTPAAPPRWPFFSRSQRGFGAKIAPCACAARRPRRVQLRAARAPATAAAAVGGLHSLQEGEGGAAGTSDKAGARDAR